MSKCFALYLPLTFPEGLSAASGSDYNVIRLARDGQNRAVLRGTSLAGVLRHEYARNHGSECEKRFFGTAEGDELYARQSSSDKPSLIEVPDCVLEFPGTQTDSCQRTHHLRNRHTGTVLDKGLFSIQSCLPGAICGCVIWLNPVDASGSGISENDAQSFLSELAGYFDPQTGGLLVGGNGARGVGRAVLNGQARQTSYDLSAPAQYEQYLEYRRKIAAASTDNMVSALASRTGWTDVEPLEVNKNRLTIKFTLTIPRGQDILVADGQGSNAGMEPQRVVNADGKTFWRLPGSTLRGLFRANITRLAARAGKTVADSAELYETRMNKACPKDQAYTGENLAWAFMKTLDLQEARNKITTQYPVDDLFGTSQKKGRIHISDAFAVCTDEYDKNKDPSRCEEQLRKHVMIDPISGGASGGALFDNTVLTSVNSPEFEVTITIDNPQSDEVRWMAQTIRALDLGVLRIGSSKSAGRVCLSKDFSLSGMLSDDFEIAYYDDYPQEYETHKVEPPIVENSYITGTLKIQNTRRGDRIINLAYQRPGATRNSEQRVYESACHFDVNKAKDGDTVKIWKNGGTIDKVIHDALPVQRPAANACGPIADASVIGMPFRNPYTFIPFSEIAGHTAPHLRSEGEDGSKPKAQRISGVISMKVITKSPLLTIQPKDMDDTNDTSDEISHYLPMSIGADVIVPATAVRGMLRNLTMILTGSSLTCCNGFVTVSRSLLGPTNEYDTQKKLPQKIFLAEVTHAGNSLSNGRVRLSAKEPAIVLLKDLFECWKAKNGKPNSTILEEFRKACNDDNNKNSNKKQLWFGLGANNRITDCDTKRTDSCPWRLKLSGEAVGFNGKYEYTDFKGIKHRKKEVLYYWDDSQPEITILAEKWAMYASCNVNGSHPVLANGDLVWLEPVNRDLTSISVDGDVNSIQWARMGRKGMAMVDKCRLQMPDSIRSDGKVDFTTNLFGQVGMVDGAPTFAGRVRLSNLVFNDAIEEVYPNVLLSALMNPHPSCAPFYMNNGNDKGNDKGNYKGNYKGYKVYRTTNETGIDGPWNYYVQGIYDNDKLCDPQSKTDMLRKVDILKPELEGNMEIAFQCLTPEELGVLIWVCNCPWRLGGGKPFGLGLCKAEIVKITDEFGNTIDENDFTPGTEIALSLLQTQTQLWKNSQIPVPMLRYPRAVAANNNGKTRGGHSWFGRHCASKIDNDGTTPPQNLFINEEYFSKEVNLTGTGIIEIKAQLLPVLPKDDFFDPLSDLSDCLFGYDGLTKEIKHNRRNEVTSFSHSSCTGSNVNREKQLAQDSYKNE